MKIHNILIPALALALIAGCSTTTTRTEIAKEEAELFEIQQKAREEREEAKMKQRQVELNNTPVWAIEPPRPDESGFYGVGIGSHESMAVAIRKAELAAEYELAKEINNELSGEDTLAGYGEGEYRFIINSFVNSVNLSGSETAKREIIVTPEGYRVFTLAKLPYREFNRVLQDQEASPEKETIEQAYQRLMDRVDAASEKTSGAPPVNSNSGEDGGEG